MRALIHLPILALMVLGACTSPETKPAVEVTQPGSTTAPTLGQDFASPTATLAEEVEVDETTQIRVSPFDAALGTITDPVALSNAHAEYNLEWAEYITDCVRNEGFSGWAHEVYPGPTPGQLVSGSGSNALAQFGYGVVLSRRGTWLTVAEEELATEEDRFLTATEFSETLPEEEREAFILIAATCKLDANRDVKRPEIYIEELAIEIAEIREEAYESSAIAEAEIAWSNCMSDQGYQFQHRDDAIDFLESQTSQLDEFLLTVLFSEDPPSQTDRDKFEELIQPIETQEREITTVDLACTQQTKMDEIIEETVWAAEEAWLADNGERVALLLAELSQN